MIDIEIKTSADPARASVPQVVEQAFAGEALIVTMRGTLAQYPGCIHWHVKRGKEPGTLEATWWPEQNRLWFKVATGRSADWIDKTAARLKTQIESYLLDV